MSYCNICNIPSYQDGAPMQGQTSLTYMSDCQKEKGEQSPPSLLQKIIHERDRIVVSVRTNLAPKTNSGRVIKTTMTELTEEVIWHVGNFLPLLDRFIEFP
jgi:hypothetical protein